MVEKFITFLFWVLTLNVLPFIINVLPIKERRSVMSPAHGRPPSKDPKRNDTRIRLTDSEREKLDFCAKKTGMTKSNVIRQGIDLVYQKVIKE